MSDEDNEDCDCDDSYSYVCPEHRKSVPEMLDEEDGVGKLIYLTYCDVEGVCGATKVAELSEVAEKIFEEGKRRGAKPLGQLPTKPTSTAWNIDAGNLLAMGASSIDAATVRGMLQELYTLRDAAADKMQETYEGPCITEADEALEKALQLVNGEDP